MPPIHRLALAFCCACMSLSVHAVQPVQTPMQMNTQKTATAEALVDAQLAAYNRHDLEAFLGFYADDAELVDYPDHVTQTGKAAMRARYAKRFATPGLHATIAKRIVFGDFVVDHEQITAENVAGVREAVAIYEVKDGRIVRVTFLKP